MHQFLPNPVSRPGTPRVTVIAQCYNHERYLRECLDSIQRQSYRDFELIVIDDCSHDRSRDAIAEWIAAHRPDTLFLQPPENLGVSGSLNLAIRRAKGEFIIRVATDDAWEPALLERLVGRFDTLDAVFAAVYSDSTRVDEHGARLPGDFVTFHHHGEVPEGDIFAMVCEHNWIPASAILLRAAALREVGEFDESLAYEDWDMWIRLAERFHFAFVPEPLARYRILQSSLLRTLFVKGQRNPDVCATHCAMALKVLSSPRVTAALRLRWSRTLAESAYELYELWDPRAARYLLAAGRANRERRRRLVLLGAISLTHLPLRWLGRSPGPL